MLGPRGRPLSGLLLAAAALALAGCGRGVGPDGGATPGGAERVTAPMRDPTATLPAPTPTPTPTPPGPTLTRITAPGCCPLPFWSADSRTVSFWHSPADGPPGVYGVPASGGDLARVADVPAGKHLAGRFTSIRDGQDVVLTRTSDGRAWRFATQGENLVLSADGTQVAWVVSLGESVPGRPPPPRVHWRASLEAGDPVRVEVPSAYALSDWTASGAWLLARADRRRTELPALVRFDPDTAEEQSLFDGDRLRSFRISPGRSWLAVTRTFEDNPADNGLYVIATDAARPPRRLEVAGGYQWRDDERLLVVPMEPGAESMRLLQVDAASGDVTPLTDPAETPFRIAAGEWSVSPDGARMAFRSAIDDAVWVLSLPGSGAANKED